MIINEVSSGANKYFVTYQSIPFLKKELSIKVGAISKLDFFQMKVTVASGKNFVRKKIFSLQKCT